MCSQSSLTGKGPCRHQPEPLAGKTCERSVSKPGSGDDVGQGEAPIPISAAGDTAAQCPARAEGSASSGSLPVRGSKRGPQ